VSFKPLNPIASVNGYAIAPGYYEAFEHASDEDNKQALLNAWTTPEQQLYNLTHDTCGECHGRGYKQYRNKQGRIIRENVGCPVCLGTGAVPKMWPSRA
jgi:hypothetical protein